MDPRNRSVLRTYARTASPRFLFFFVTAKSPLIFVLSTRLSLGFRFSFSVLVFFFREADYIGFGHPTAYRTTDRSESQGISIYRQCSQTITSTSTPGCLPVPHQSTLLCTQECTTSQYAMSKMLCCSELHYAATTCGCLLPWSRPAVSHGTVRYFYCYCCYCRCYCYCCSAVHRCR